MQISLQQATMVYCFSNVFILTSHMHYEEDAWLCKLMAIFFTR